MLFTRQFFWLFRWHVVRYARRHALLAALNVLSVALGVAVYLAIQIANHSANQSFTASIDLVAGKANLEVRSPSGGFDEALLARLRHAPGVKAATPLVEGYVTLPDYPGEFLQVLGLDVFTNVPFATFAVGTPANAAPATDQTAGSGGSSGGGGAGPLDLESWLGQPDGVAVSEEFARLYRLRVGDRLRVQVDGRDATLVIRNLISLKDSPAGRGNSRVAAMDIGWAQELFRRAGRLSAIQLLVDRPLQAERIAADLRPLAPPDVTINPPGQRSGQVQRMLAGFELNLGALSLVALLVGMFLISNTVTASVVRRRTEVGTLRAAGASQAEVTALFLAEALLYGLVGVAVGVVGGVLLAQYLIGEKVAQVIRTLYILVSIDRYYLTPWLVGTAAFFGLGSVLLAAWLPAWHGARIHPVAALSLGPTMERGRLDAPRWLIGGAVGLVLAAGCGWLALTTGPAWLGFASAFFVLLGFALFAPRLTVAGGAGVGRLARLRGAAPLLPAAGGGPGSDHPAPGGPAAAVPASTPAARLGWGRICLGLGAENLVRAVHRTAVIIAALMAAIAMTIGISVMIHAFRTTVQVWISRAVVADIFITPRANETLGNGAFMPPEIVRRLQTDPAVAAVDLVREIGIDYQGERISMAVVEGDQRDQLTFVGGHDHDKLARFYEPGNVLVTEAFARKHGVGEGSRLPIPTPGGVVDFTVAGVYYDYSRDQGIVAMHRSNFLRYWHDPRVMSAALHLRDPARLDAVADELRQAINGHGEFLIFSNRSLRERIFQIFDQTFAVTSVLRGIAVAVALIGIFLTLTTLVTEREREIGVLRALGASRAQLQAMVLSESALIGLLASILGLGAGLALSVVLTFVINRAFFGWTIQLVVPWTTVLVTPLWIVGAALVAGWLPALRAGRVPIAAAVRAE